MPDLVPGAATRSLAQFSTSMNATFQPSGGLFSPGLPPIPPDAQPMRVFDFPAGVNLQQTPRAYDPFGFPALRAFANVELVRLAIETRKDQIDRLDWRVKKIGAKSTDLNDPQIKEAMRFLRKPDGHMHFAPWMRMLIEDLLVLDAPAIELRRTRAGKLAAIDVVDGATIKVLVDSDGRRPVAPEPAYQQVIKGRIWTTLSTRDLLYAPRNMRAGHLYGFGPVEQIIVTINTLLQRQAAQLAYFTSGTIPAGLMNSPEGWTPQQIKELQDWMDARLAGNTQERAKLLWGPSNAKYTAFKESPLKDDFDEWLARVVAFCFSLPPTPFVRQMNRATAEADQQRALKEGLSPLLAWAKRTMDDIVQEGLGFAGLEFVWEVPSDTDPKTQAEIDDIDLKNATRSLNEVRDARGLDPYTDPLASQPMALTVNGYVPLSAYQDGRDDKATAAEALAQSKTGENDDGKVDKNEDEDEK